MDKEHVCQYCHQFSGSIFEVGLHLWEKHLLQTENCPLCRKNTHIFRHVKSHGVCLVCLKPADVNQKKGPNNCRLDCEDTFMTPSLDEYVQRKQKM